MTGEFDLIETYLAPLAGPGTFGLKNDAAVFSVAAGEAVVATADAMVQGIHFLAEDPPDLVARKLLRVNLSDIAAMGARPFGYLLTVALPRALGEDWFAGLASGLAADQEAFQVALLGGDTVTTPGPPTLSLTALGRVAEGRALRRDAAKAGDEVYLSGSLGDGALGLLVLQGRLSGLADAERDVLAGRYRLPQPRLGLGQALAARGLASAAIDVSDGLVADLGHIAAGSGLAAVVEAEALPLSPAASAALAADSALLGTLLTGGDDYELLFTAAPAARQTLAALAGELELTLARIGRLEAGSGVTVLDRQGKVLALERGGWAHF